MSDASSIISSSSNSDEELVQNPFKNIETLELPSMPGSAHHVISKADEAKMAKCFQENEALLELLNSSCPSPEVPNMNSHSFAPQGCQALETIYRPNDPITNFVGNHPDNETEHKNGNDNHVVGDLMSKAASIRKQLSFGICEPGDFAEESIREQDETPIDITSILNQYLASEINTEGSRTDSVKVTSFINQTVKENQFREYNELKNKNIPSICTEVTAKGFQTDCNGVGLVEENYENSFANRTQHLANSLDSVSNRIREYDSLPLFSKEIVGLQNLCLFGGDQTYQNAVTETDVTFVDAPDGSEFLFNAQNQSPTEDLALKNSSIKEQMKRPKTAVGGEFPLLKDEIENLAEETGTNNVKFECFTDLEASSPSLLASLKCNECVAGVVPNANGNLEPKNNASLNVALKPQLTLENVSKEREDMEDSSLLAEKKSAMSPKNITEIQNQKLNQHEDLFDFVKNSVIASETKLSRIGETSDLSCYNENHDVRPEKQSSELLPSTFETEDLSVQKNKIAKRKIFKAGKSRFQKGFIPPWKSGIDSMSEGDTSTTQTCGFKSTQAGEILSDESTSEEVSLQVIEESQIISRDSVGTPENNIPGNFKEQNLRTTDLSNMLCQRDINMEDGNLKPGSEVDIESGDPKSSLPQNLGIGIKKCFESATKTGKCVTTIMANISGAPSSPKTYNEEPHPNSCIKELDSISGAEKPVSSNNLLESIPRTFLNEYQANKSILLDGVDSSDVGKFEPIIINENNSGPFAKGFAIEKSENKNNLCIEMQDAEANHQPLDKVNSVENIFHANVKFDNLHEENKNGSTPTDLGSCIKVDIFNDDRSCFTGLEGEENTNALATGDIAAFSRKNESNLETSVYEVASCGDENLAESLLQVKEKSHAEKCDTFHLPGDSKAQQVNLSTLGNEDRFEVEGNKGKGYVKELDSRSSLQTDEEDLHRKSQQSICRPRDVDQSTKRKRRRRDVDTITDSQLFIGSGCLRSKRKTSKPCKETNSCISCQPEGNSENGNGCLKENSLSYSLLFENTNSRYTRNKTKVLKRKLMNSKTKTNAHVTDKEYLMEMISEKMDAIGNLIEKEKMKSRLNPKTLSQACSKLKRLKPVLTKIEILFDSHNVKGRKGVLIRKKDFLFLHYENLHKKIMTMMRKDEKHLAEKVPKPLNQIDKEDISDLIFSSSKTDFSKKLQCFQNGEASFYGKLRQKNEDIKAWNHTVMRKTGLLGEHENFPRSSKRARQLCSPSFPSVHSNCEDSLFENDQPAGLNSDYESSELGHRGDKTSSGKRIIGPGTINSPQFNNNPTVRENISKNSETKSFSGWADQIIENSTLENSKPVNQVESKICNKNIHKERSGVQEKNYSKSKILKNHFGLDENETNHVNRDQYQDLTKKNEEPTKEQRILNALSKEELKKISSVASSQGLPPCEWIKLSNDVNGNNSSRVPSASENFIKFNEAEQKVPKIREDSIAANAGDVVFETLVGSKSCENKSNGKNESTDENFEQSRFKAQISKNSILANSCILDADSSSISLLRTRYQTLNCHQVSNVPNADHGNLRLLDNNAKFSQALCIKTSGPPMNNPKNSTFNGSVTCLKSQKSSKAMLKTKSEEVTNFHRAHSSTLSANETQIIPNTDLSLPKSTLVTNISSSQPSGLIKNKPASKKPTRPELSGLVNCGLIKPDFRSLTVHTPERLVFASVHDTGHIISESGKSYSKLLHWCTSVPNFFKAGQKPTKVECYERVFYQGRCLSYYKHAYDALVDQATDQVSADAAGNGPCGPEGAAPVPIVLDLSRMKVLLIGDNEVGEFVVQIDRWDNIDKWET